MFAFNAQSGFEFQSTRLHEARLGASPTLSTNIKFQSTRLHEARQLKFDTLYIIKGFNPRACMRRDLSFSLCYPFKVLFQSTRLHEARHLHHSNGLFER